MHGSSLLYIMRTCKNGIKPDGNITKTYYNIVPQTKVCNLRLNFLRVTLGITAFASVYSVQ